MFCILTQSHFLNSLIKEGQCLTSSINSGLLVICLSVLVDKNPVDTIRMLSVVLEYCNMVDSTYSMEL